jgi:hypothetical protein
MSRHWSRRQVLAASSALAVSTLSGCSNLPFSSSSSQLDIRISNFDTERYLLDVEAIKPDGSDLSSATVLSESYELQAAAGPVDPFRVSESISIANQRYLIRTQLAGMDETQSHYHFDPDCKNSEEIPDRLNIDVRTIDGQSVPDIEFRQNECSG